MNPNVLQNWALAIILCAIAVLFVAGAIFAMFSLWITIKDELDC
jgi:hypothetical protein